MIVLSWNIQNGKGCDGKISLDRIAGVIRDMCDPDVICLQELSRSLPLGADEAGPDQVAEISKLFPGYETIFGAAVEAGSTDETRRWQFGNATLTRLPIVSVFQHALPRPAQAGVRHMPRQAIEITVATSRKQVRIVNTHLEFHSAVQRTAQVERLHGLHAEIVANNVAAPIADDSGPYQSLSRASDCVICGDFNMEMNSPQYQALLQPIAEIGLSLNDAWPIANGDALHQPTCGIYDRTQWPQGPHCRDFFFVTETLKPDVRNVSVNSETSASDHQPILLELTA